MTLSPRGRRRADRTDAAMQTTWPCRGRRGRGDDGGAGVRPSLCMSQPGHMLRLVDGTAPVRLPDRTCRCTALAQPDARTGDRVPARADLIVGRISAEAAAETTGRLHALRGEDPA